MATKQNWLNNRRTVEKQEEGLIPYSGGISSRQGYSSKMCMSASTHRNKQPLLYHTNTHKPHRCSPLMLALWLPTICLHHNSDCLCCLHLKDSKWSCGGQDMLCNDLSLLKHLVLKQYQVQNIINFGGNKNTLTDASQDKTLKYGLRNVLAKKLISLTRWSSWQKLSICYFV